MQTKYEEVEVVQEKIVQVITEIEKIKEVPVLQELLVPIIKELPKIFEFQKDAKIIPAPPRIEVIEKIKPYIVNVNQYIERIVEKLVEVPYLLKETNLQEMVKAQIEMGPERHTKDTEVVELTVERELIREVEQRVVDTVHRIDEVLKTATEIIEKERDPVIITKDRIIEIPYVLEKIVEKITVMPQIVEVLKYVHEIIEEDNLKILCDLDVEVTQYKDMSLTLERELPSFLEEMRKIKVSSPQSSRSIDLVEKYISEFKRYLKHPKLIEKIK